MIIGEIDWDKGFLFRFVWGLQIIFFGGIVIIIYSQVLSIRIIYMIFLSYVSYLEKCLCC